MAAQIYFSPPYPFSDIEERKFAAIYLDWSWCEPAQIGKRMIRKWVTEYGPKFDVFIADGDNEKAGQWWMEQWEAGIRVDDNGWGSLVFAEKGKATGLITKIYTRNIAYIDEQAELYIKSFISRMGVENLQ